MKRKEMSCIIVRAVAQRKLYLLSLFFILLWTNVVQAQCPNDNVFWTVEGQPPCGSAQAVQVGGGTYVEFDVALGASYTFSTCGSSFDTQLTGYEGGNAAPVFYNNTSPNCGLQAEATWISTFSGTLRVNVDQFNCTFSTTSAVLSFRQNDNLTFTPPSPFCIGDGAFDLSTFANSAAGTFSGPGVSGTTFDPAVAGSGSHIITYALAQCTEQATIVVTLSPTVNVVSTDVSCNGADDGEATANASGGGGSYTYAWSDPNNQTTQTATGLAPGTYNVTVTDANGCETSGSATISEPTVLSTSVVSTINPSCGGVNNGQIEVSASGGTSPYEYSINGSPYQPSETFVNLPDGTFTIEVRDANLCTASTAPTTLTNSYNITASVDSVKNISCARGGDGRIEVSASGGTAPYEYSKDNVIYQASGVFDNLSAGSYSILARDAVGCSDIVQVTVIEPADITVLLDSLDNVTCNGDSTGSIYVSVSGGTSPYTYEWSNGSTSQDLENVPAGVYSLTVTDVNNCVAYYQNSISEPLELFMNLASSTNPLCYNGANGRLDITVNGGVPSYFYSWSTGSTNEDLVSIVAGTYSVTVTDANGCTTDSMFTLTQPDSIATSIIGTDADCSNGLGGSVDLTVSGGTGGYTYFWSNGAFTQDLTDVPGNSYFVQVVDANGCTAVDSFEVNEPNPIVIDVFKKSAGCGDDADGIIDLTVTGGTPGYDYNWDGRPGVNSNIITNVASGVYSVTVTDANGCEAVETIALSSFAEPNVDFFFENACDGETVSFYNNSTISSGSMTFVWRFGDGDSLPVPNPDHLYATAGIYSVELTATSDNDCSVTIDTTLEIYELPNAFVAVDGDSLNECSEDEAVLSTSFDAAYQYQWSNGEDSSTITVNQPGVYSITVTDQNGCVNYSSATVRIADPESVSVSSDTTISFGFSVQLEATGGVLYTWSPADFLSSDIVADPIATPPTDQTYIVLIEGEFGCTYMDTVNITVVQDFALEIPNIITPNGDGFNDQWRVNNITSYPHQVSIFNRWGNEVYSSKNYDNTWDGDELGDGTYYYIIRFEDNDKVYKGAVTILR